MFYDAYQAHADAVWPTRTLSRALVPWLMDPPLGGRAPQRQLAAACEVFNLVEVTHRRPDWGIHDSGGVPVIESEIFSTPFAALTRFARAQPNPGPRVLLVAPMSGHFATLLRDTVRTMVADHEVYVTDWFNARDVPRAAGRFGLDEYVAHLMQFLEVLGPGTHLVAICQPCVAALAATALMAEDHHIAQPATLTLMAGPIDCRIGPTAVNELATAKPIEWFEQHLISTVPWRLPGAGRRVYPGFVQLGAFMSMNRERHLNALREYYGHLVAEAHEKAAGTRDFYREYFAVADLPAEFYLETVERVFQRHDLPRGELTWRGRKVDPGAIRRTALLTVEGERDDICSVGQTLAAQDLCSGLRPYMKRHHVQAGVGHYGVFSGRRWQQQIYPQLRETIHLFDDRGLSRPDRSA
jgi:poly(3-hydroxybutyrate) depolymerase